MYKIQQIEKLIRQKNLDVVAICTKHTRKEAALKISKQIDMTITHNDMTDLVSIFNIKQPSRKRIPMPPLEDVIGMTAKDLSVKYKISQNTAYNWMNKYLEQLRNA